MAETPNAVEEALSNGLAEMFQVLTLIHAVYDLHEKGDSSIGDLSGLTTVNSRISSLLLLARDKTACAIRAIDIS